MLETLPGEIIGDSAEAQSLRRVVEFAAKCHNPVTLTGEAGTGKETAARLIHEASERKAEPFLGVDCALFYERELKRELFGYCAGGSFRRKGRKGLFEFASKGTCYLSRIEELSPGIQTDLLQFLKSNAFTRLGDGQRIPSAVRIVVSSTKNLTGFVEAGLFDKNLHEILSRVSARIVPLRERRTDVSAIVRQLVAVHGMEHPGKAAATFSAEALEALEAYPWPGNLDELEKEILRLLGSSQGTIRPEHLAMEIVNCYLGQRGDPLVRSVLDELDGHIREFRVLSRLDLSYVEFLNVVGKGEAKLTTSSREDVAVLLDSLEEGDEESVDDDVRGEQ